jgi:hypothetical protein
VSHQDYLHAHLPGHVAQELGHARLQGLSHHAERLVQGQQVPGLRRQLHHDQPQDEPGHLRVAAAAGVGHRGLDAHAVVLGADQRLQRRLPAALAGLEAERVLLTEDVLQALRRQRLKPLARAFLRLLADRGQQRRCLGVHVDLVLQARDGGLHRQAVSCHLLGAAGLAVQETAPAPDRLREHGDVGQGLHHCSLDKSAAETSDTQSAKSDGVSNVTFTLPSVTAACSPVRNRSLLTAIRPSGRRAGTPACGYRPSFARTRP